MKIVLQDWTNGPWIGYGDKQKGTQYILWSDYFDRFAATASKPDNRMSQEDICPGLMWGAYTNYTTEENNDKGLLIYKSFSITFNPEASSAFTASFDWKETGGSFNKNYKAPYYEGSAYTEYKAKGAGLANKDDAARILWQGTWRMPRSAEFKALRDATYWKWDDTDKGYYVYAPQSGDAGKKNSDNGVTGTYNKSAALLFFPAAGLGTSTSLNNAGTNGYYWSSTVEPSPYAFYLIISSKNVNPQGSDNYRYIGFSVRPVSD